MPACWLQVSWDPGSRLKETPPRGQCYAAGRGKALCIPGTLPLLFSFYQQVAVMGQETVPTCGDADLTWEWGGELGMMTKSTTA